MRLRRRQDEPSSSSEPPSSITPTPSSTGDEPATTLVLDENDFASSPLPEPFDTSLGNNFTSSSCPEFFNRFLADPEFDACLPLSLLLQVSACLYILS